MTVKTYMELAVRFLKTIELKLDRDPTKKETLFIEECTFGTLLDLLRSSGIPRGNKEFSNEHDRDCKLKNIFSYC